MAVQLVAGRAGCGKTHWCVQHTVQLLRQDPLRARVIWLVPRQATFQTERLLTCQSGLSGFRGVDVLSFDLLARQTLAECGGAAGAEIDGRGRQLIIGFLLRRNQEQLRYYRNVARQVGLARQVDDALCELQRSGADEQSLEAAINHLGQTPEEQHPGGLADKLHDLLLLHNQYQAYLGNERLDPQRRLERLTHALQNSESIKRAHVLVDGFTQFSGQEEKILAQLGKVAAGVSITLLMDERAGLLDHPHELPDDFELFYSTLHTWRKLYFACHKAQVTLLPPVRLGERRRFESAALGRIEEGLIGAVSAADGVKAAGEALLVECADVRQEAQAAVRQVRKWMRQGLRLRQITILARDLETYGEPLRAALAEAQIAHFIDRRRTMAHHPLVRFCRAALRLAYDRHDAQGLSGLLKCGLAALTLAEADGLENYAREHRLIAAAWLSDPPWQYRARAGDPEREQASSDLPDQEAEPLRRKFIDPLLPFVERFSKLQAAPLRHWVVGLYELMERYQVRGRLSEWIDAAAEDLPQRQEHEQAWAQLVELLDQLVDILGEEAVTSWQFAELLDQQLEELDLALTPPTLDQVLVGQVDRTRTDEAAAVVVVGMNEGEFPRVCAPRGLFSDAERKWLPQVQLQIEPDTRRQLLDENLLGYIALTRASRHLCLTRRVCGAKGQPTTASPWWRRVVELFDDVTPLAAASAGGAAEQLAHIGSARGLLQWLMEWVRQDERDDPADDPRPWLYQWLTAHPCRGDTVDRLRYRCWRALRYDNSARLPAELVQRLFGAELRMSVTRLESYAACPFQYFIKYVVGVRQEQEQELSVLDLGNAAHQMLEQLIRQVAMENPAGRELAKVDDKTLQNNITNLQKTVAEELGGEVFLASQHNRRLLNRMGQVVAQWFIQQRDNEQRTAFAPAQVEMSFGMDHSPIQPLKISLDDSRTLSISGKIDRIDLSKAQEPDGSRAAAVYDYKLSQASLAWPKVWHGLSLQLLTYLLVLQDYGQDMPGGSVRPVGAFYSQLLHAIESSDGPLEEQEAMEQLRQRLRPRGIFVQESGRQFDQQLEPGLTSPVVRLKLNKDGKVNAQNSDPISAQNFARLLQLARDNMRKLGQRLIGGAIDISPYLLGKQTPCAYCQLRGVCRFERSVNQYHVLQSINAKGVREQLEQMQ